MKCFRITYNKLKEIHYRRSNQILNNDFVVTINFNDDKNLTTEQKFRLILHRDAINFYRLITERRIFYSLPLIDNVTARYSSNFTILNNLVNTFSNMTTANKQNIQSNRFECDVDRTMKQCYDDIRRIMYKFNNEFDKLISQNLATLHDNTNEAKIDNLQWIDQVMFDKMF